MTPDERIIEAFLVADDVLRQGLPPTTNAAGFPILVDARMPLGLTAQRTPNGSIVVKELP